MASRTGHSVRVEPVRCHCTITPSAAIGDQQQRQLEIVVEDERGKHGDEEAADGAAQRDQQVEPRQESAARADARTISP